MHRKVLSLLSLHKRAGHCTQHTLLACKEIKCTKRVSGGSFDHPRAAFQRLPSAIVELFFHIILLKFLKFGRWSGWSFNKVSTFPLRNENVCSSRSAAYKRVRGMFSTISTQQCDLCKIGYIQRWLSPSQSNCNRELWIEDNSRHWIISLNKCHLARCKVNAPLLEDAEIFQCLSFSRTAETAYTMFVKDLGEERDEIPREKSLISLSLST